MNRTADKRFVETIEYRRFVEFCDACRHYRYIGLCYGPPGVGKTLSARHYANWDKVELYGSLLVPRDINLSEVLSSTIIVYTVPVVNTPNKVAQDIDAKRKTLRDIRLEDLYRQRDEQFAKLQQLEEMEDKAIRDRQDWSQSTRRRLSESMNEARRQLHIEHSHRERATPDPTVLIIIDEADRLKMGSLEQVRAIFDRGGISIILIGMPGLEKRLARYPQLYSRIGFVHHYRTLSREDIRQLLRDRWCPSGLLLPEDGLLDDGIASIIRITGGNFRLLHRLLTQIGRILEINSLRRVTREVVEAARDSLVIGTD